MLLWSLDRRQSDRFVCVLMCIKWLCVSLCVCVKWVCVSLCMCFVLLFLHSMRVQCEWVVQINTVGVFCVFRCEKQFSVNLRPPCYYEPLVCRLLSFLPTFPSVLLTEPCFSTSHFITPPHTLLFFSTLTRSFFFFSAHLFSPFCPRSLAASDAQSSYMIWEQQLIAFFLFH